MPRLLFVKTSSLGDVIHHCPAVSDVARHVPGARIDWIVEEGFAEVAALHRAVERVIPVAVRRWRAALWNPAVWAEIAALRRGLAAERYDMVIDTQGLVKSALLARAAHGTRHGYDTASAREPLASLLYDVRHAVPREPHAVERNRGLCAAALGYALQGPCEYGLRSEGAAPIEARGPVCVLLTMSSRAAKLWAEPRWAQLGAQLAAQGITCLLPWGSDAERERCARIAAAIPGALVPRRMTLGELARQMRHARACVGTDTGLAHLAAALGVPAVALFCGTDPARTGLHGGPHVRNLGAPGAPPAVAEVLAALAQLGGGALMWRRLYTLLLAASLPLMLIRLWWRGRREPGYRRNVGERFGRYALRPARELLWLHAVSVGEVRASAPLVAALRREWPRHEVLVTCMTAAGREAIRQVYGESVLAAYLPYDLPRAMRRFLERFRPRLGVLMETEIWFNLIAACGEIDVPLVLANARLSQASARGYARLPGLTRPAFAALSAVCAQSAADAERLRACGARNVVVTGNLKFDVRPDAAQLAGGRAWRSALGERRVLLLASTREGEEALLLDALPPDGDLLTVIVPRHERRFDAVAELAAQRSGGAPVGRRSRGDSPGAGCRLYIGDTMGEMAFYFAAADVAVIGGSFLPLGGQNLIEACAAGTPVVFGPSMFNFAEAARHALQEGAALQAADAARAVGTALELLADAARRSRMGEAGRRLCEAHRGATGRHLEVIGAFLPRGA